MDDYYTVEQLCGQLRISHTHFYNLRREGKAPDSYLVGRQRRISRQAFEAWRSAQTETT